MTQTFEQFLDQFRRHLPPAEVLQPCPDRFWQHMGVNAERVHEKLTQPAYVKDHLPALGEAGLYVAAAWAGIDISQADTEDEVLSLVAEQIAKQPQSVVCQTITLLALFLYGRRAEAIETIARALLDDESFTFIKQSNIDDWSKRFGYTLLAYLLDYQRLRLLLLFESGERAGYVRCTLTPEAEKRGQPLPDEEIQEIEARVKTGADLTQLSVETIDGVLEHFETRGGGRRSRCFDVFEDTTGTRLIFILRQWREAVIREVDDVIFADEAELIVLRLKEKGIRLEEHGTSQVSRRIAAAIMGHLLGEPRVQYLEDTQLTKRKELDAFLNRYLIADVDENIRFQEIYLYNSAIEQTPRLILRCGKKETLAPSINFLRERQIDLLATLEDIRHVKIAYVQAPDTRQEKSYIFKLFFKPQRSGDFFIPYSVSNVPTLVRSNCERYLWEEYHVRIIPGTG